MVGRKTAGVGQTYFVDSDVDFDPGFDFDLDLPALASCYAKALVSMAWSRHGHRVLGGPLRARGAHSWVDSRLNARPGKAHSYPLTAYHRPGEVLGLRV